MKRACEEDITSGSGRSASLENSGSFVPFSMGSSTVF